MKVRDHDAYLDGLRGLAALIVFLTHVRGELFVQWTDLDASSHGPVNYALFVLTRLGREAVIVFFVLSGYLVGGQALIALRQRRFSASDYFAARLSRLYVVVVPALLLTSIADYLAGTWTVARNGAPVFWLNLLFLQQIFGDSYGSNGPLWSLAYEWWFYAMFGLALTVCARLQNRAALLASLLFAAAVALLWVRCPLILLMFPLWLAGVLARTAPLPQIGSPRTLVAVTAFGLVCGALVLSSAWRNWQGDFTVGAAVAVLLYVLRGAPRPRGAWTVAAGSMAAFSFSLYAAHYPINKLIFARWMAGRHTHAGPGQWLQWLFIAVCEAAICWVFYWLFERRTPVLRRILSSFSPRNANPVAANDSVTL